MDRVPLRRRTGEVLEHRGDVFGAAESGAVFEGADVLFLVAGLIAGMEVSR